MEIKDIQSHVDLYKGWKTGINIILNSKSMKTWIISFGLCVFNDKIKDNIKWDIFDIGILYIKVQLENHTHQWKT